MKVLWFTNIPMPSATKRLGIQVQGSGYWMSSLLANLAESGKLELAVATSWPGTEDSSFMSEGVQYFVLGQRRGTSHLIHTEQDVRNCVSIVNGWCPDVIHVYGTERYYGLLAKRYQAETPVLISLQGLLHQINTCFFGDMKTREIIFAHTILGAVRGYGLLFDYLQSKKAALRELEIMRDCNVFTGRTHWDKAHLLSINPSAQYFHINELLRDVFYEREWSLASVTRHSVMLTNARSPIRNVETLLSAISILTGAFGDITLKIAGSLSLDAGYGKHLCEVIDQYGLADRVSLIGYLGEKELAEQLLQSHVFCNTSLVENSPNSLCEAQLLGMPCIGSFTGGIPSLIEEGSTGLLFAPRDAAVLAECIRRIFTDDSLATNLGTQARKVACERHNPASVVSELLAVYKGLAINKTPNRDAS